MKTLVVVILLCTCSGCLQIGSYYQDAQSLDAVNRLGQSEVLYVQDSRGHRSMAEQLMMSPTQTTWIDAISGTQVTMPTAEIVDIKTQESVTRQRSGFGVGFLAGASMGVMAGVTADGESSDHIGLRRAACDRWLQRGSRRELDHSRTCVESRSLRRHHFGVCSERPNDEGPPT